MANAEQACVRNNMLFTLKSYEHARTTVQGIVDFLVGNGQKPRSESAGNQVADLRQFASLWKK